MHIEINTAELTVEDRRALIALLSEYDRPASIPMPTRVVAAAEQAVEAGVVVIPKPASEALIEVAAAQRTETVVPTTASFEGRTGVALDKNGLPHDARIHASTAVLNVDGTWRAKRNVDPALVETVEAELRAVMAAPGPIPTPPVAAEVPTPPVAAEVPTPPVAAEVPTPPAAVSPFAAVMKRVVALQGAGRITSAEVTQTCADIGLGNIRDLAKRPDLIPSFEALLPE